MNIQAYPLAWPSGWKRIDAGARRSGAFNVRERLAEGGRRVRDVTIPDAIKRVMYQLERLGVDVDDVVVSTNIRPTLSGVPASRGTGSNVDPGVAVYWFERRGPSNRQRCIAVDRYATVADNLAAISATLEAMRAIERHGGAEILDRAFTGFAALPAPEQPWQVLGLETSSPTRQQVDDAYRRLAAEHHPDRRGGNAAAMARINAARDDLYARLGL